MCVCQACLVHLLPHCVCVCFELVVVSRMDLIRRRLLFRLLIKFSCCDHRVPLQLHLIYFELLLG